MKLLTLLLACGLLANAFAQTDPGRSRKERSVQRMAGEVQRLLTRRAKNLTYLQLDQFERELRQMRQTLMRTPGPVPFPRPVPPPQPQRNLCELLGPGKFNNWSYNFRVAVDGKVMAASDDLSKALDKLDQLADARVCTKRRAPVNCQLRGPGKWGAWTYLYRLQLGQEMINGQDNFGQLLNVLTELKDADMCVVTPLGKCELLEEGKWSSWTYTYRVSLAGEVVYGTDQLKPALDKMAELRKLNFCY